MTDTPADRAAPRRLDKLTLDYSAAEDRLLGRVQAVDGKHSAVWLTQRLARRLVRMLCDHLRKSAGTDLTAPSGRTTDGKGPANREHLLSFRHQAAMMKREPAPPVPDVDAGDAPLLEEIRAQLSRHRILLTLELTDGPATLALTQDHAWQLLQILLNLFRRAEWPLDAWPGWMRKGEADAASGPGSVQALH